jgi:hypothetical protein
MATKGINWVRFVRQYGPIARNDSMYDEHIFRAARRVGVRPIRFCHPFEESVLDAFRADSPKALSVIVTGTAGDGKSHLCARVWELIGGDAIDWASDDIYYVQQTTIAGRQITVHIIRDLTALPQQDEKNRYLSRQQLLEYFCRALFDPSSPDVFLIAANDGHLIESWQQMESTEEVAKAQRIIESLLVDGDREREGVPLRFLNLSRVPSTHLFDLCVKSFLDHEGWKDCYEEAAEAGFFGTCCPIRHNYELLKQPLVLSRLRSLFELCDSNELHVPIRRLLLLLANAVLGHPDAKDRLMRPGDVPGIIAKGTVAGASLFNNLFGGNLSTTRREALEVFDYLNRFGIGRETSNRIDNILIFGEADENLRPYFEALLASDAFYGADESYYAAQREYVEGADESNANSQAFLDLLVSQRRGLFFKIPPEQEEELGLWQLTVFKFAGEYLARVVGVLRQGGKPERRILARLVRGLNRVFVGLLVNTDRELLVATSLSFSNARVSYLLEDRISVTPHLSEKVELGSVKDRPVLRVCLNDKVQPALNLNLTRYEFLSRVAEGALPSSFSKECYEDILAFKSEILAALEERQPPDPTVLTFRMLSLDDNGNPAEDVVEVNRD